VTVAGGNPFLSVISATQKPFSANRTSQNSAMKYVKSIFVIALVALVSACTNLSSKDDMGVVIARRAQVRSSTAVVAADLKEVARGDVLEILDSTSSEGEQWLRVRTLEAENTEGWIEARNVMPQDSLERSRQLAKEDGGIAAQASGQLRASTNIRLSPDREKTDNILMKLESGSQFEIVGWKRVPKTKDSGAGDEDESFKGEATQQSDKKGAGNNEVKEPLSQFDLWYKVRLPPSISPAPAGWIYGKQVELSVPSDIVFFRTGREFVAWQRLDGSDSVFQDVVDDKDAAKEARPGSWIILEKSSTHNLDAKDLPDFDRIFVLGYDKERQDHYTAYRSPDLRGYLPLEVQQRSDEKIFSVNAILDKSITKLSFRAYTDDRGVLKVQALNEIIKGKRQ
jgi:hypothetical protein